MKSPSISTTTASLETSLQNFSLNSTNHHGGGAFRTALGDDDDDWESSSSSDDATTDRRPLQNQAVASSDASLELNSNVSLPYHWEQCLDLKTGEIYYINWRNGTKAREDPRTSHRYNNNAEFYSEEEDDDSEESSSSSGSSSSSSRDNNNSSISSNRRRLLLDKEDHVLVVAGCKSCLMYFMVPKLVEDCPKCTGHLLHF